MTVTGNMIVGGTSVIQFGPLADKTLISANNIRGVVSAVEASQHKKVICFKQQI